MVGEVRDASHTVPRPLTSPHCWDHGQRVAAVRPPCLSPHHRCRGAAVPHLRGPDALPRHDQGGHHRRLLHGGRRHAGVRGARGVRRQGRQPGEASPSHHPRDDGPPALPATQGVSRSTAGCPRLPSTTGLPASFAASGAAGARDIAWWSHVLLSARRGVRWLACRVALERVRRGTGSGHGALHQGAVHAHGRAHPGPDRPPCRACGGGAGRRPEPQAHRLWRCAVEQSWHAILTRPLTLAHRRKTRACARALASLLLCLQTWSTRAAACRAPACPPASR